MLYIFRSSYSGAGNLNLIDLSDNKISDLPQGAFTGISRENVQINLYENRLNCSCSLAWLKTWTNHVRIIVFFNAIYINRGAIVKTSLSIPKDWGSNPGRCNRHRSPTARHRCDVSSELCCPGV